MYLLVLTDNSNIDETKLPLDNTTNIVKEEILPIVDGPKSSKGEYAFKYVSPTYQLNKKYEYSGGKNGIAPFALCNSHHVLTQLSELNYKPSIILDAFGFGSLDGIDSRKTRYSRRDKYGETLYDEDGMPIVDEDRGERILDWLSAMINAHVDVAKDPYVIRLNIVQWTYTMANFLLRSGLGRDTFFFLPQPILKDIAAEVQKLDGNYGVDSTASRTQLEQEAIKSILDKYKNKAASFGDQAIDAVDTLMSVTFKDYESLKNVISRDFLVDQLVDSRSTNKEFAYYYNQLKVWKVYEALMPYAKEMSELVTLSQIDTKKFGNNLNLQRQFIYRLKDFIYNNKVFDKSDIVKFFKTTFLDTKIRNSVLFNNDLFKGLLISSTNQFEEQVSKILQLINQKVTKDDTLLKLIANELETSIKSEFFGSITETDTLKDMYYGPDSMAARLSRLKTDILLGKYSDMISTDGTILNELLNYLSSEFKQVTEIYDSPNIITIPRIKSNDKYLEKRLTKYWQELLDSPHAEVSQFAKDLAIYAFYSSGDNYNKNSFFNLLPNAYRKELHYDDAIKDALYKLNENNFENSLENVFLNTWYNNNLVKEVKLGSKDVTIFSTSKIGVNKISYPVMIAKSSLYPVGINKEKQPIYRPFIKVNIDKTNNPETTILYKYIGYIINKDEEYVPIYVAVDKKGMYLNGKVVREYTTSKSILPFNNLPYKYGDSDLFEVEEYTDNEGTVKKRYKNVVITNKHTRDTWKKILNDVVLIENTEVLDPINILTYDDVLNGNYSKLDVYKDAIEEMEKSSDVSTKIESDNKFTFKDGVTIDTPFALNSQQADALNALSDFVKSPQLSNNEITLTGYAGTGKTTIIGLFDKYLRLTQSVKPKYAAVTYRANSVTKMNNPDADTYTLNKLFGISAETDLSDSTLDMRNIINQQKYNPKVEYGDLIIIDEASMVSQAFYDFVESAKNTNSIKVIYVGDPAQLAPITKDGNVKLSPVFSGKQGKVIGLTKVERTGDNPILTEATALREGKDLSYVTQLNDKGEGITYTNSNEEVTKFMNDSFNSKEFKENKLYFRVLTGVNDMIPTINGTVRRSVFGDNRSQLEVGELLTGYDNLTRAGNEEPDIINSGDYEVTKVSKGSTSVTLPTRGDTSKLRSVKIDSYTTTLVDVMNKKKTVTLNIASNTVPMAIVNDIANELQLLYSAVSIAYKNREYNKAKKLQDLMSDIRTSFVSMQNIERGGKLKIKKLLDYGYAQTVHKSQGGTYNKVLIYADTIDRFQQEATRQQLKYVAVSRAKENVVILTNIIKPTIVQNDVLRNQKGNPITLYRGYGMVEDREAEDIDETVAGTASDYAEGVDAKYHFTTSKEEAEDYAKLRTDKSIEPTREGKINRHYVGDYAKVGAYNISSNAKIAMFNDLHDFNKNKDSDKVKNADVIILREGTLFGAPEYVVKSTAKDLILKAKPTDKFDQLSEEEQGTSAQDMFKSSVASIMSSMVAGNEDTEVQGNSIHNLVTTNDNGIKEMYISTRKQELEELIQQRTDIDANAARAEFNSVVESHSQSNSDTLNNSLIQLLCKY